MQGGFCLLDRRKYHFALGAEKALGNPRVPSALCYLNVSVTGEKESFFLFAAPNYLARGLDIASLRRAAAEWAFHRIPPINKLCKIILIIKSVWERCPFIVSF